MADTIGSLIDKLFTVDTKMWYNQELLYKIRKMTFAEFFKNYNSEENLFKLWEILKKCCDLNYQRNSLIEEIDKKLVEMIETSKSVESLYNEQFIQKAHKTY